MKTQSPTTQTSITIIDRAVELDFAALSAIVGAEASYLRSLHHITRAGTPPPIRSSEWSVSIEPEVIDSVDEGIRRLLDGNWPGWIAAAAYCELHGHEIWMTSRVKVFDWDDRPFIELSRVTIDKLRQLDAQWKLDWVDLSR